LQAIRSWAAEGKEKCGKKAFRVSQNDERDLAESSIIKLVKGIHSFCVLLNSRMTAVDQVDKTSPTFDQLRDGTVRCDSVLERNKHNWFHTTIDDLLASGRIARMHIAQCLPSTGARLVLNLLAACDNAEQLTLVGSKGVATERTPAAMALAYSMCISQMMPLTIVGLPGAVDDMLILVEASHMRPVPKWLLAIQSTRKRNKSCLESQVAYIVKPGVHKSEVRTELNERMYDLSVIWHLAVNCLGSGMPCEPAATRVVCAFRKTWSQIRKAEAARFGFTRPQDVNAIDATPLCPKLAQSMVRLFSVC
jgi:hypothetical protein